MQAATVRAGACPAHTGPADACGSGAGVARSGGGARSVGGGGNVLTGVGGVDGVDGLYSYGLYNLDRHGHGRESCGLYSYVSAGGVEGVVGLKVACDTYDARDAQTHKIHALPAPTHPHGSPPVSQGMWQ